MNELLLVVSVVSIGDAAMMSRDKSEKLMRRKTQPNISVHTQGVRP